MGSKGLREEYDPEKLQAITPNNRSFKMLSTPRYLNHYLHNGYEDFSAELLLNLSKDGMVFVDIGAHYGFYTLLVGTRHRNSKVFAFEPAPENYEVLKKNVETNNLKNVEIYNLAVSEREEIKRFNITKDSGCCGFYPHPLAKTLREIEVKTVVLDSFLREIPKVPLIIKIDVEGHEIYVLEGMRGIIEDATDLMFFIEFNPDSLKSAGFQPEDLLEKIDQLGFDIYFIDDEGRETYKVRQEDFRNWKKYFGEVNFKKNYFNLLCQRKQKSLSVCFFSHSAQLFGAEKCLLDLTTDLIRDYGVNCTVILPEDGPLRRKLHHVGASTVVADYSWWCDLNLVPNGEATLRLCEGFTRVALYIRQKLEKINPDVIFTNTLTIPWGAIIALILDKPHLWFIHEFGELDHNLKFFLPFETILNIIRDASNLILTNSNAVKEVLFGNSSKKKVLTVYYHIDIPPGAVSEKAENYFERENATKLIMTVGGSETKGERDAILAVKMLDEKKKDVELLIMDVWPFPGYLEDLKEMVKNEKLEKCVKFSGFWENPFPVVNMADIVLACSRNEAFGRMTLEAMLLKKPVIGTNSGGTRELIKEGLNGLLYEPGHYIELAEKIQYLVEHQEKIEEFGENGYKLAKETFTKEEFSGKLYKLLKNLKDTKNPCSADVSRFMTNLMSHTLYYIEAALKGNNAFRGNILQQIDELEGQLTSIRNSWIWKITKPLRKIYSIFEPKVKKRIRK